MADRMIHHVDIRVSDVDASLRFYAAALEPLGFAVTSDGDDPNGSREVSFGGTLNEFAIHEPSDAPGQDAVTTGAHIAFQASGREAVDAFHRAAVAAGAQSIGEPGLRPQYSEGYYGAFVLDPDGNNIEAVIHLDERPGG
jgi:catechol 2,3-dioxygenase-like lactoylglutathione lyase family enzyme